VNWHLVTYDAVALAGVHLASVYVARRLPDHFYRPGRWWWRIRPIERDGRLYQDALRIRAWKHLLPDGGPLLPGGFAKSHLAARDGAYLDQFAIETGRGELAHWLALLSAPAFALFNPPAAIAYIQLYAIATNVPCIAVQRFNRARLLKMSRRAVLIRQP
jgi:glycosyl-4,4'-diaponeurosporenoate acyltransferase